MITATGIGSGLDIESLVTQLVAAERSPVETRLNASEFQFASELSAFGQFKGALAAVESSLDDLASLSTYRSLTSSSSDEDALTVSAGSSATPANYTVGVSQLAQAHSLASASYTSLESELGTGTITIRTGTTDYVSDDPGPESYNSFSLNPESDTLSIEIDSTNNTLVGIRDAINAADGNVNAVIVNDGSGYRLLINSSEEGEENSLQLVVEDTGDLDDTDTSGLSAFAFNASTTNMEQTVVAQDASFTVNGLPITSSSNEVTDAIDGVTLSLNTVTESDVSVSIARDTNAVASAINQFISSYNSFVETVDALAGYDPDAQVGGILQSDFTVRSIEGRMRQLITGSVEGSSGAYSYMAEVGVTTGADGRLVLDQTALNAAIDENPEGLEDLFAAIGRPSNTSVNYISDSDDTQVGTYAVNITQAATRAELIGTALSFPLDIDDDNDGFVISVNGESSGNISLTQGTYASGADLAAEMQSRINGDDTLAESSYRVVVEFNEGTNAFEIRSEEYGSAISLEIVSADTNFSADLGLTQDLLSEGLDVQGTIGGQSATGLGQSLVADADTDASGMSLVIESDQIGDFGSIVYTRGLADQLDTLTEIYLESNGLIDSRTESLNEQIEDLTTQREALELRIESVEARYRNQFNVMDALLASLNTTSSFLTTQLANLPGAIDNNRN